MGSPFESALRGVSRIWGNRMRRAQAKGLRRAVERLLCSNEVPDTEISEAAYDSLCAKYDAPDEYGYDRKSTWRRGLQRAQQLMAFVPTLNHGQTSLEVACGDGMTSLQLALLGMKPTLSDLTDWRDGRAVHLPFQTCDLVSDDSFRGDCYDFVFSYNAFEHFSEPTTALRKMVNATKPGGFLFFEFGPIYTGPWGLHAYRMLPMPYPQFLFSENFWRKKLESSGVRDLGQELDDLQPLNRWTVSQFDALWRGSGCEILVVRKYAIEDYLSVVIDYPKAFQGRGLAYEDVTTQAVLVLLRKPQ